MPRKSEFSSVQIDPRSFTTIILEKIKTHAAADPNKIAFLNAHDQSDFVTFGQFYENTQKIATFLKQRGFGWNDVACIVTQNCWQFVVSFIGVSLCGGSLSGASYLFTPFEIQRQLVDCNASVVFCSTDTLESTRKALKGSPNVKTLILIDSKDGKTQLRPNEYSFSSILQTTKPIYVDQLDCDPKKHLLLIPYSSGTTGAPKGVLLTHFNMIAIIEMFRDYYAQHIWPKIDPNFCISEEKLVVMLPLYHLYGLFLVAQSLFTGMTCILMQKFDGELFCQCIEKFKIRVQYLVPPIVLFLAKHPIISKYDLSSLKFILSGAAPLSGEICAAVQKRLPTLKYIVQGYGMTESTVATHFPILTKELNLACVGKLAPNCEEMIVDVETGKELPQGQSGEILVRGPIICLGYLNRPQATAQTIDKDKFLHTGDIGYLDSNNCLYIVDRLKELIKVKGLQVAPAELEAILITHPEIIDCAVVGVKDERDGERPKAFVVRKTNQLTAQNIHEFLKPKVAPYKRLKEIEFCQMIPKSPSGKILRRELRNANSKI